MADENDVRDHFFSGKNMNFTYGIIRQEVNSKCGYDIDKSPKLKENLINSSPNLIKNGPKLKFGSFMFLPLEESSAVGNSKDP